jgi:hypothetical protein
MSKLAGLQSALNASTGRAATVRAIDTAPAVTATVTDISRPPKGAAASSRVGKDNIAAWLPNEFKRSIRLVQAKKAGDPSLQDLMAEAFNDLFIKYNVPTVSMNE